MKDYELPFYLHYCMRRCKSFEHCPWLCISGETCLELTEFEERKENENDSERKETV